LLHHVGVSATVSEARDWVRAASGVAVLTGAGISAESGVPTFRGPSGLWQTYRPEDLATPEAFRRDPVLVWEWYNWRRERIAEAAPNPGHLALAALERRRSRFTLVTQNVDGLHDRAGNHRILKLHGDIWRLRCLECGIDWADRRVPLPTLPPHCRCGGMARPGVVWFGEQLGPVWGEAESAARNCEVFVVAGTSAVVYPAASLILVAKRSGAKVIEVNIEETPFSELVDCSLRGPSGELLPQLTAE
jgi:NAD-dependent deacetylase